MSEPSFTCFPRLPTELQLKVWLMAMRPRMHVFRLFTEEMPIIIQFNVETNEPTEGLTMAPAMSCKQAHGEISRKLIKADLSCFPAISPAREPTPEQERVLQRAVETFNRMAKLIDKLSDALDLGNRDLPDLPISDRKEFIKKTEILQKEVNRVARDYEDKCSDSLEVTVKTRSESINRTMPDKPYWDIDYILNDLLKDLRRSSISTPAIQQNVDSLGELQEYIACSLDQYKLPGDIKLALPRHAGHRYAQTRGAKQGFAIAPDMDLVYIFSTCAQYHLFDDLCHAPWFPNVQYLAVLTWNNEAPGFWESPLGDEDITFPNNKLKEIRLVTQFSHWDYSNITESFASKLPRDAFGFVDRKEFYDLLGDTKWPRENPNDRERAEVAMKEAEDELTTRFSRDSDSDIKLRYVIDLDSAPFGNWDSSSPHKRLLASDWASTRWFMNRR
ncbi:hypothetical protein F5Y14DRAFT_446312 [Nemania sp. NC0429]|nr:hypothetical protein F5Y14DRAFT_446312 [Nemania sp. NC0429]